MYESSNRRIINNTIALYIRTFIVLIILLYTSRLLLKELGISDFGTYNLIGSVVVMFSFLNNAMTQAIQRFTTYELGKGNLAGLHKVFITSIITQIFNLCIIIILAETVGLWFLNNHLNIPIERISAAKVCYQLTIITLCISIIRVPYEAMIISHEKMSVYAYLGIFDAILKLVVVIIIPLIKFDRIILYSYGITIETFIIFFFYRLYCINKIYGCKFHILWDWPLFKKILSFSGWSLCGGVTNVITQNGFIFIINIFYGVLINAAMGIANQVSYAVSSFVGSFQTSFRPQLIKSYAQNNINRVLSLISKTSKISFILTFFPSLFLVINMKMVLQLWLFEVPNYSVEFCRLILISLVIDATTGPYNIAITATGFIRNYQIAISCSFILDLLISYFLIKSGIHPQFILYSRIITRGFLNMFIGWYYMKEHLAFAIKKYLQEVIIPIIWGLFIIIPCSLLLYYYTSGWRLLVWSFLSIVILGFLTSYFVILNKDEKIILVSLIKRKDEI